MIYVDMRGNLGNQFFIYAFARKIQKETGQDICINTYNLKKYYPDYSFTLDYYKLNSSVFFEKNRRLPFFMNVNAFLPKTFFRIISLFPKINDVISRILFKVLSSFGYYLWQNETYIRIPIKKRKNYYISGFWQSEKFFDDIREVLLKEFTPKEELLDKNEALMSTIKNSESICVTIRRGDYINNEKIKKNYYVCDSKYFYSAIKKIKNVYPNTVVICFSDDIDWVKKNMDFNCKTYYESGNDPVWEKIRLMSSCKHFVLSNSSFSWWAAYLSTRKNGMTVAPSTWYLDERPADIYRKNWKFVKVGETKR